MLSAPQSGALAEARFDVEIMARGGQVFSPEQHFQEIDKVVITDATFRVQIKSIRTEGGVARLRRQIARGVYEPYENIDLFAIYFLANWWLVPQDHLPGTQNINLLAQPDYEDAWHYLCLPNTPFQ